MATNDKHIQKQIDELQENLKLIEVRKSEFVESTAIPLQLIKTEEQTRAKLAALEEALQQATRARYPPSRAHAGPWWLYWWGLG